MQRADAVDLWPIRDTGKVETEGNLDVLLREMIDLIVSTSWHQLSQVETAENYQGNFLRVKVTQGGRLVRQ
jgi:hypothetical protein